MYLINAYYCLIFDIINTTTGCKHKEHNYKNLVYT